MYNLDVKYKKAYLIKLMKDQFQRLTETKRNEWLKLLQKSEELFEETLVIWKTDPVELELKMDEKPICSRPCTVPEVYKEMLKN